MNKESYYYIKYKNLYITHIYLDINCPENEFIDEIELSMSKEYCKAFTYEQADCLIEKLEYLGFSDSLITLEETITEKTTEVGMGLEYEDE